MKRKDYEDRAKKRFKDIISLAQKNIRYSKIAAALDVSVSLVKSNVAKAKKVGLLVNKLSLAFIKTQVVKVRSLYSLRSKGFFLGTPYRLIDASVLVAAMLFYPLKNIRRLSKCH